ncbi:MAG TPA: TolC family protein [Saprospiraceae bacterium]|nr:TolC family protein [Saprospiraceae bacterium]
MNFRKFISAISIFITLNIPVFSQTVNIIDLFSCIESGTRNHPLHLNFGVLDQSLETQHKIADAAAYPGISWNTTAKAQSESISLEFDNPMLPSFEVPFYSFNSALELNYVVYDGGYKQQLKATQSAANKTQKQQLAVEIDQVKSQIVQLYLSVLLLDEKDKILRLNLEKILDNRKLVESLVKHGVADKNMVLQWEVKEMELNNQIESNQKDRLAQIKHLESVARITIPAGASFQTPDFAESLFNGKALRKELMLLDMQKAQMETQSKLLETGSKPKVFVFGTAGVGYPNPLNFFDDQFALYAIGGVGVSWKFYDWNKRKKEQQVIKFQQNMIDNQQNLLNDIFSQQDEKHQVLVQKYEDLIRQQAAINIKMEEIAMIQKSKMENGTQLPIEFLRSMNDFLEGQLKLSQYRLELVRVKTEFLLMKGKL